MARTLKTLSDTGDFILVQALEPYVQRYRILHVMNAQSRDYNSEMEIEYGRGSCGAIYPRVLGYRVRLRGQGSDPCLWFQPFVCSIPF